jgi:hypothetical protein
MSTGAVVWFSPRIFSGIRGLRVSDSNQFL